MAKQDRVSNHIPTSGSDLQEKIIYLFIDETIQRCCRSLKTFIRGLCVECTIIALTVVDIFFITVELLIRAEVLQDPLESKSIDYRSSQSSNTTAQNDIDPGGGCRTCNFDTSLGAAYCVSHYISLVIAMIFFIELLFRFVTGCSKMCKDVIQLIDSFTVFNLAAIEVLFTIFWEKTLCFHIAIEAITFIVALRLLRIPKACNVLKEDYSEKMDLEVHYLSKAKSKAEERSRELANTVQKQQTEIETLRKQLGSGSLYENDIIVHTRGTDDLDSSTISNGHVPSEASVTHSGHSGQSPKFVSTIKTDSHIVSMTTQPVPNRESKDSNVSYAVIENNSNRQRRIESGENKAIYKNVCHVKSPSQEVKRTSSEVGSRITFESDIDTKNLIHRSKSTKSSKGEAIRRAIAMLENNKSPIETHPGGPSVSRTPSNKLSDLDNTKLQENDSGCVNGSFESDEEVVKRNLPVMSEYRGTRTYRSAEGVPLTDL
ncbi:uncharacterized protein LOC143072704 isoform X2 [Mytilus galloprovincialis]|uniref:uncharacterized protein LOC143072704 isoform X2 n=1 Tax=Mytilus galloprovincialis TaxID=29158 RepID=UPI003F7CA806